MSNPYVMLATFGLLWCAVFKKRFLRTAYRTIRESWKRAVPRQEPQSGGLAKLMNSPVTLRLSPAVKFQIFVNWSKAQYDNCLQPRLKRLDRTLESIDALEDAWRRTNLIIEYEINHLNGAKKYLMNQGIGFVSVGTQTPRRAATPVSQQQQQEQEQERRRQQEQQQQQDVGIETDDIGFLSPDQWDHAAILNKITEFGTTVYGLLEPCYACARIVIRAAISHIETPTALTAFVTTIVDWFERTVYVITDVDLEDMTTEVVLELTRTG